MAKVYAYCRYSLDRPGTTSLSDAEAQEKDSIQVQKEAITQYREHFLKDAEWVDFFVDARTSAGIPFLEREAGGRLNSQLSRGDHVVMAKLDRGFRSTKDCAITLGLWEEAGVNLHVINIGLNTNNAVGKMVIQILAVFAEFERSIIRERCREAMINRARRLKAKGYRMGATKWAPLGYKIIKKGGGHKVIGRVLVPDLEERALCKQIKQWHDEGFSVIDICFHMEHLKIGQKQTLHGRPRPWAVGRIKKAIAMVESGLWDKEEEALKRNESTPK